MASEESKLNVALFLKQDEKGNVINNGGQEVDLNNYALKSELTTGLKTKANVGELTKYVLLKDVENLISNKLTDADFVKNNKLSSLATKKSVDDLKVELTASINNLNNFNPSVLNNYATKSSLGNYATTAQVRDKLGREEAEEIYLKKVDLPAIPDLTEFTTYSYVDARVTTKSDELEGRLERKMLEAIKEGNIQLDVSNLVTYKVANETYSKKSDLLEYAKLTDLQDIQINTNVLSSYVKKDSLNTDIGNYLSTADITSLLDRIALNKLVDFSAYYTKIDVDRLIANAVTNGSIDLSNYDTSIEVDAKLQNVVDKMTELEGIVTVARNDINNALKNVPDKNLMVSKDVYESNNNIVRQKLNEIDFTLQDLSNREEHIISLSDNSENNVDNISGYWDNANKVILEYYKNVSALVVDTDTETDKSLTVTVDISIETKVFSKTENSGFIIQEMTILDLPTGIVTGKEGGFAKFSRYVKIDNNIDSATFSKWKLI